MELWPSCSTAFPLKPNTPEVSSCSQIKTKIYLGLQDPPWSNLFLPHLTRIAPLSSLWCFECSEFWVWCFEFSSAVGPWLMLFSPLEKLSPHACIPLSLLTSLSKSLQFSLQCQLSCHFHGFYFPPSVFSSHTAFLLGSSYQSCSWFGHFLYLYL